MRKIIQLLTQPTSTRINLFLVFVLLIGFAQAQNAKISGKVIDEYQYPIVDVLITAGENTTYTNGNGEFNLEIPANTEVQVRFESEGRNPFTETLNLSSNESKVF